MQPSYHKTIFHIVQLLARCHRESACCRVKKFDSLAVDRQDSGQGGHVVQYEDIEATYVKWKSGFEFRRLGAASA
jgi:hypothetical protein